VAGVIDAVVVGSGPNGLGAAIVLAEARRKVLVLEAQPTIGGGARSGELTMPGFVHDICSAIHPFAVVSPLFRTLPLDRYGLEWIEPPAMLAHPFDDAAPAIVHRSLDATMAGLDEDGAAYGRLMTPIVTGWSRLERSILGPLGFTSHPVALGRFGAKALRSAKDVAHGSFRTDRARALFAGNAAHGMLPLDKWLTAGFGLVLGSLSHICGWVLPRGGAQSIANALAAYLRSLGGEIRTETPVRSMADIPEARAVLFDLSPAPFLRIAGDRLPVSYRRLLERYRYGMGVYKMDWALDGPIPWRDAACASAGTVHLGGTFAEIAASESDAWNGRISERPFVLLTQPSLFDSSRAPAGRHTAWAYCHVPHASTADMSATIERQIERFAPRFRERILARHITAPADLERNNANLVGGDIAAGVADLGQFFLRPTWRTYSTPLRGVYLCSASTPPGVGVHGMCGCFAAQLALREVLRD